MLAAHVRDGRCRGGKVRYRENETKAATQGAIVLLTILVVIALGLMIGIPKYRVYAQDLAGQANLKQQEWEKKIKVEEARAVLESSKLLAEAEVERARGIREANEIIQTSLGGPEGYLRYLYIQQLGTLQESGGQVIYVPTEAGIPILEAGRR